MAEDGAEKGQSSVMQRLQRVGLKRPAASMSPEVEPPIKREEPAESDSDSDSAVNELRHATRRAQRNRNARAAAAAAAISGGVRTTRPMPRSVVSGAARGPARATASPAGRPSGKSKAEEIAVASVQMIAVPDFFQQGVLDMHVLEEIEKMYEPVSWNREEIVENPRLYVPDKVEEERIRLAQIGAFEQPLAFNVIAQMLQRQPQSQMTTGQIQKELSYLTVIEAISRDYEESMLRTPRSGERACCNGTDCQAYDWFRFVMVEFLTPREARELANNKPRNSVTGLCLLCRRKMGTMMRAISILTNTDKTQNYVFQLHRNIVNRPGEYSHEEIMSMRATMPYVFVENARRKFTHVVEPNGHHRLLQTGYPKPIDPKSAEAQAVFSSGTPQQRTPAAAAGARSQPRPAPAPQRPL
jgi:hypothetical protein